MAICLRAPDHQRTEFAPLLHGPDLQSVNAGHERVKDVSRPALPSSLVDVQPRTHLPATGSCPLCPSQDGAATEFPAEDYDVVVFDNRFPFPGPRSTSLGSVLALVDGDPL